MKKIIQTFFFFFFLHCAAYAQLDRIIAIVNDEVITQSEYDRRMEALKIVGKSSKKETIDTLIDDSIKLQLAKKVNIKIDDEALNKSIQGIAAGNHVTVQQLYGYIEQQGFSKQSYQEMIRKQMTIARVMQQQFGDHVRMTKADVAKYQAKLAAKQSVEMGFEEYNVTNILIPIPDSAKTAELQAIRLQAQHLYEELKANKPLEQLAQEYPLAEQNNLGWRKSNELPQLFLTHLQAMKVKEVSMPFQAPNGFQILVLNAKRADDAAKQAQTVSFKQAEQALYQEKLTETAKPWLEKARKQSFVKILI